LRNRALYTAGLVLGAANTVRHRLQGYVNPRPFSAEHLDRALDHAFGVVGDIERRGVDWSGQAVLEVGPGPDLATGALILDRGAASYASVDLFDNRSQTPPELYRRLESRIGSPVDHSRLSFTQTSFPDLPDLTDTYDLVISNACLEHVADVGALFRRLRELVAPGGRMVHQIDGKAHMRWFRDRDPLNHLRYSDRIYCSILDFPGAPNRLRAADYASLARRGGWSSVEVMPDTVATDSYLHGLRAAKRFRGVQTLDFLTFTLSASVPARTA
jgi:SAM-dependent methyltransferase